MLDNKEDEKGLVDFFVQDLLEKARQEEEAKVFKEKFGSQEEANKGKSALELIVASAESEQKMNEKVER